MADQAENSSDAASPEAERVVGRPFPKGVSGNPGGRPKGHKAILEELLGKHGAKGWRMVLDVAEGRTSYEVLAREPGPNEDVASAALIPLVRKVPTIRERLDATQYMLDHLVGKATAHVEVEGKIETESRFILSRVPDTILEVMAQGLELASTDAEFEDVDAVPGMLPAGWETPPLALPPGEPQPAQLVDLPEPEVWPVDGSTACESDYTWVE